MTGNDCLAHLMQVIESFEEALNGDSRDPTISPNAKSIDGTEHEKLLQELEERLRLGERLLRFYQRYNPDFTLQQLSGVLDKYVGREEDVCAELRSKYNADLHGEYAPPREPTPIQPGREWTSDLGAAQVQDDKNVGASASHATGAQDSRSHASAGNVIERQMFIKRLTHFYSIHDPSHMSSVEDEVCNTICTHMQRGGTGLLLKCTLAIQSMLTAGKEGASVETLARHLLTARRRQARTYAGHEEQFNSILRDQYNGCDLNDPDGLGFPHRPPPRAPSHASRIPPPQTYEQMHHAYPAHAEIFPGAFVLRTSVTNPKACWMWRPQEDDDT